MEAMSKTRLIVPHSFISLHTNRFRKYKSYFLTNRGQIAKSNIKMDFVVYNSVKPGNPIPSGTPPTPWKKWFLGLLITAILPFLRHNLGPLLKLTGEIESAVDIAENVAETIEKVAEEVEKVAEDIADDLPGDGNFKRAIVSIENAAERTAKAAHFIDSVIDKVQEVEIEVESFIEPGTHQANEIVKKANGHK